MNNSKPVNPCKVITGKDTRLSYEHVWEPASINGGNPKYSACVMWPKTDEVTTRKVNDAIEAAYREGESRLKGSGKAVPPMTAIKNPLRDGDLDRPDDPAYAGMWFVNANSDRAPGIVDLACNTIIDRSEVYSGCYCRVSMTFYAFNSNGIGNQFFNTIYLVFLSLLISVPSGVLAGIYMAEYAGDNKLTKAIRISIESLSSLPSIVVGLFGYLVFILMTGMKWNLFAGALAVSILSLPSITTTTEDALRSLPKSYKEGSMGLGATHWTTITKVMLPACISRIMTGVIFTPRDSPRSSTGRTGTSRQRPAR